MVIVITSQFNIVYNLVVESGGWRDVSIVLKRKKERRRKKKHLVYIFIHPDWQIEALVEKQTN